MEPVAWSDAPLIAAALPSAGSQWVAVEPGVALAAWVDAIGELLRAGGRPQRDVAPERAIGGSPTRRGRTPCSGASCRRTWWSAAPAHRVIDDLVIDDKSDRAHFAMSLLTEAMAPTNARC